MAEINLNAAEGINLTPPPTPAASSAATDVATDFWGEDGFSFGDILDLINPLQHIPIIGTIYRAVTGDQTSIGSSIIGGAVFGGIIGVGAAVVNAIIDEVTGGEISDHIVAMFGAGEAPSADDAPALLASAESQDDHGDGDIQVWHVTGSDSPSHEAALVTAPPPAAGAERQVAIDPTAAAPRATISKVPAPLIAPAPIAPAPDLAAPALAPRPVFEPAKGALAFTTAQGAPRAGQPAPSAPLDPAWLTAIPRAEGDFTTAAMRYITPDTWLQLARTVTENPEWRLTRGPSEMTRDAINRYSHQAMAAKAMTTGPGMVDILK